MGKRWTRYRKRMADNRETVIGNYHVRLTRHLLFHESEVRVWKDVRPALGGLIGRNVMHDTDAERLYEEVITTLSEDQ